MTVKHCLLRNNTSDRIRKILRIVEDGWSIVLVRGSSLLVLQRCVTGPNSWWQDLRFVEFLSLIHISRNIMYIGWCLLYHVPKLHTILYFCSSTLSSFGIRHSPKGEIVSMLWRDQKNSVVIDVVIYYINENGSYIRLLFDIDRGQVFRYTINNSCSII